MLDPTSPMSWTAICTNAGRPEKSPAWATPRLCARHAAASPARDLGLNAELWEGSTGVDRGAGDDWDAAIGGFSRAEGRSASTRISGNLEYCSTSGPEIFETDWPAAVKAYESALELLPGSSLLENNLRYCRQQVKSTVEKKVP